MPKMPHKPKKAKKPKKANANIAKNAESAKIAKISEIAKIAETELVRFLQISKFGSFLEEIDGLFEKKPGILFKVSKGCKFAVECVSNGFFSQKFLPD